MKKNSLQQSQQAWLGVIAPLLFVAVFTLEGCLRPGYSALSMYVSELGLGPRGWIQNVNFILFGILFLLFTRAVAARFQSGKASRWGLVFLTIIALCYLGFGFFVMDPVTTPRSGITLHGFIHFFMGEIVLVLMPVSCFVFLPGFRAAKWRSLQAWTLVLGMLISIASTLLLAAMNLPVVQGILAGWLGLVQRISIVPFMLWLFILGLGMIRNSKTA